MENLELRTPLARPAAKRCNTGTDWLGWRQGGHYRGQRAVCYPTTRSTGRPASPTAPLHPRVQARGLHQLTAGFGRPRER